MPPLTITGTFANGIQVPVPDPISGGSGSLALYDGWIDVDFAATGSAQVDAIAEFDLGQRVSWESDAHESEPDRTPTIPTQLPTEMAGSKWRRWGTRTGPVWWDQ